MRWQSLPVKLILLALLGVFLVYPIAYIVPGAFSDESFEMRLLGETPEQKAHALLALTQIEKGGLADAGSIAFPHVVQSFPGALKTRADQLAERLNALGATAVVVRERQWTSFYFAQALGFQWQRQESFPYFRLVPNAPALMASLVNSLLLATATTLLTTVVCIPLAYWFTRFRFPGQGLLAGLLLVPLILPPFVGAIGLQRFLDRFGALNLWLMQWGVMDPGRPIDWLGQGGLMGVVMMQVLHLYPILYLNLAAAWANVDPTLEDAARNLGAGEWRVFRTITFPLVLPGYFAGASLVFVWSFTDLGTPLVFNFIQVIPVKIFDQVSDPQRTNPVAFALVVVTLVVTGVLFLAARWAVNRRAFISSGKGAMAVAPPRAGRALVLTAYGTVFLLTFLAILPNIGVVLTAMAERWSFTPLPEAFTTRYLTDVWSNRVASTSIRNSVFYSSLSTGINLVMGVSLAWLIARRPSWLSSILEGLAMLPLALPGLVLAFGYLTCYSNWDFGFGSGFLDPSKNPVPLLIIAYSVRRLPYLTRSALAGLQQIAPVLEEAAENLGASRWRVLRTVTVPLIAANLIAGGILTFAFALLEVSDSLMLAREEQYFPITRAILGLLMRPDDGDQLASALAVYAMALLAASLMTAALLLGRKMGELFRA